nr:MAG TPA: hypothetical protein [Caudoviricetes sp.]
MFIVLLIGDIDLLELLCHHKKIFFLYKILTIL